MSPTPVRYNFKAADAFWKNFHALDDRQKATVRKVWSRFKLNPFDPVLRTHKIHSLSARAGETIYSVTVESNLRVVFCIRGDMIYTVDIGTHVIYGRG